MANVKRGECELTIGGVDFIIKIDMNAFAEMEDALQMSIQEILNQAESGKVSVRFIRAALYAGLKHDLRFKRKPLTIEKAGSLINLNNMTEIAEAVIAAIGSALTGKTVDEIKAGALKATDESDEVMENPFDPSPGMNSDPLPTPSGSES